MRCSEKENKNMDNIKHKRVCDVGVCTACRSCLQVCPQNCISLYNDKYDNAVALYDVNMCINCGRCQSACPQISDVELNSPLECYAGWSTDENVRKQSASGGIATEIYKYYAGQNTSYVGVTFDDTFKAVYEVRSSYKESLNFQNSKYVESDTQAVFQVVGEKLKNHEEVVFIGLPCHLAGLRKYLETIGVETKNLLLVDLVCHGVSPYIYLKQHIGAIEKRKKHVAKGCTFRDPDFGTNSYVFSVFDSDKRFYKKKVHAGDVYQIGYHYGFSYRENCYSCKYARHERIGSLTLADFSGLGKVQHLDEEIRDVSCILVNDLKGKKILSDLVAKGKIVVLQRPLEEALNYEKQLNSPTPLKKERFVFLREYEINRNFELSMQVATRKIVFHNDLKNIFHYEMLREIISRMLPGAVKKAVKFFFTK